VKRLVTIGATIALFSAPVVGVAAGSASASPRSAARVSRAVATHTATVRLAGTVNASALPRFTGAGHQAFRLPLRRAPQSIARGVRSPAAAASASSAQGPLVTVTPGTPLAGTLGDGDNITTGPGELTPPDMGFSTNGTKEIELINDVGKIWNGTTPGTAFSLATFFSPSAPSDFLSDPFVKWDVGSGRFFAGIFDVSLGGEIMAVSTTSDPSGTWNLYRVRYPSTTVTGGGCPDQGKAGVDSNVVGLGFNEFAATGVGGCPNTATFRGAAIEVFNKAEMMAGATVHFVYTDPQSGYFSLVPADTQGSSTTEFFASLNYGTSTQLHQVTSVGVPLGGPTDVTLTVLPDLTVKSYSNPPKAPQSGTTKKIDSGDDRTQNVSMSGTKLSLAATVGCKPKGDTAKRACGRVYEVDDTSTAAPLLKKSLTISAVGKYFIYPAATILGTNTVAVSIGQSSSSTFGSLYTTAGTWGLALAGPVQVQAGTAKNTTGRYGDYFAVAVQPGTTNQYWVAGEIGGTSGSTFKWNTAAGVVTVS